MNRRQLLNALSAVPVVAVLPVSAKKEAIYEETYNQIAKTVGSPVLYDKRNGSWVRFRAPDMWLGHKYE